MNTNTLSSGRGAPAPIEAYFIPPDIHEEKRAGWESIASTLLIASLAAAGHAITTYLLFWQDMSPAMWFLAHLLIAVATGLFAYLAHKAGRDMRFPLLLFIASTAMGIFGSAGTALALLLLLFYSRVSTPFIEWFRAIFPRVYVSAPERIYDDIVLGRDENARNYHVIPFMDVITVGSEAQKRQALSRMSSQFNPSFAPAFKQALSDPNNSIRVQAATATSKIENTFLERMMKLTELERKLPGDMVVKLALADHYDDYAFTGILDPEREKDNRQKAHEKYKEYLAARPEDIAARIKIGRLLLRNDDPSVAADWFAQCIKEGYGGEAITLWHIETLYRAGRYKMLREAAAALTPRIDLIKQTQPMLAHSIALWASSAA